MSQQTLEWKEYQGKQHVYWSMFKQAGDVGLVTKFKGKGDGFNPEVYGPFELDGYRYSAVQKTGRSGKQYFDIERVPINTSAPAQNNDEGWKKGHEENIAMHKESMAAINKLTESIDRLTSAVKVRESIEDTMRQHLENIDRNLMKVIKLPNAAEIAEAQKA